jgi:hypothetical protein
MPVRKKSRKRSYAKKVPRKKVIKKRSKKNSKKKKKRSRRKKNKKLISRGGSAVVDEKTGTFINVTQDKPTDVEKEVDMFINVILVKAAGIYATHFKRRRINIALNFLINILRVYFKFYIRDGQYWDIFRSPTMTDEQVFTEQFKKIKPTDQEINELKDDVKKFIKSKNIRGSETWTL